jgi:large subunit ribosomal protein L4
MPKVKIYNLKDGKKKDIELNPDIFDVEIKDNVLHRAVECQLANSRGRYAVSRRRAEVKGGGRKPWKQKGTGRARHGSIRSPLWKGGGVVFGPNAEKNYTKKINKKEKRKALFMALTSKVKEKKFIVVDELKLEKISTKKLLESLNKLPSKDNNSLVVMPKKDEIIQKSSSNLEKVKAINISNINILDILTHDYLVLTNEAVTNFEEVYKNNK